MPITFVKGNFKIGDEIQIVGQDAHHICNVLRLKTNDWIVISDTQGNLFKSIITKINSKSAKLNVIEILPKRESEGRPVLAVALIKKKGLEDIIDKAVELGTNLIIPFFSERTIVKIDKNKIESQIKRWNQIAKSAAKQSGLPYLPYVSAPVHLKELCKDFKNFSQTVLLYEGECSKPLWEIEVSKNPLIIIGPEGGFSKDEVTNLVQNGAITATLGKQILRVETAVISSLSIWGMKRGGIS